MFLSPNDLDNSGWTTTGVFTWVMSTMAYAMPGTATSAMVQQQSKAKSALDPHQA